MKFAHSMPFGAELQSGGVRFRLWAPALESVSLALEDGPSLPMQAGEEGWFELTTDAAQAGSRYRFVLPDGLRVPDPASRCQPADVHGPSAVVDPRAYDWQNGLWTGRPWHETVLYELHVGTFDQAGSFDGVRRRLDHLADLGVTAVELMPLSEFPGGRNWGYDGVLPFAPDAAYGSPSDLKRLIDEAHGRGLMVMLDVVYNHFGPDGNYLHAYAGQMFHRDKHTAWGVSIDFSLPPVRELFIQNALYWIQEYRFDGLRFDAVQAIHDTGERHFLDELGERVRAEVGPDRHVHLVLENDDNAARYLERNGSDRPRLYTAQWNDDFHHAAHHLLTGERGGYYLDYVEGPQRRLGRALAEGFIYQGEHSPYRDHARGEPSAHLPPGAFVDFLQNHDQIGNRAFGDRLAAIADRDALRAMTAILLLAPQPPLLFMGEEWGCTQPFLFFCSFDEELGRAVRDGRRREFARFPEFADPEAQTRIPDPNDPETFRRCVLDWSAIERPEHEEWLAYHRDLLRLRREQPHGRGLVPASAEVVEAGQENVVEVRWEFGEKGSLTLLANLGDEAIEDVDWPAGEVICSSREDLATAPLPGWTTVWIRSEP